MLDETIEVTFTVNPRIRKIGRMIPGTCRSGAITTRTSGALESIFPTRCLRSAIQDVTLDSVELPPREGILSLQASGSVHHRLRSGDPYGAVFDVKGEATRDRQHFSLVFDKVGVPTGTTALRPGPLRLSSRTIRVTGLADGLDRGGARSTS